MVTLIEQPKKPRLLKAEVESNKDILRRAGIKTVAPQKSSRWLAALAIGLMVLTGLVVVGLSWWMSQPSAVDRQNADNNLVSIENASRELLAAMQSYNFATDSETDVSEDLARSGEFYDVITTSKNNLLKNLLLKKLPPDDIWQPFEDYLARVAQIDGVFSEASALILPVITPTVNAVKGQNFEEILNRLRTMQSSLQSLELNNDENTDFKNKLIDGYGLLITAIDDYSQSRSKYESGYGEYPLLDSVNQALNNLNSIIKAWQDSLLIDGDFEEIKNRLSDYLT